MRKLVTAFIALVVLSAATMAMAAPIVMDGSTTVLPFGQAAVEQFMKENAGVKFSVSGTGTGNGFKSLADGSAQIANASRFIKDSEIKSCMDKNVYPVPFAVALDCIVPIVHKDNPVKGLSHAQLKDIYSGKVTNWKEVGGADAPIVVVGRDTSSGTYGTWQEMIMDKGEKTRVTPKAQVASSSGAMLSSVSKNKNAIGYEGMGYVNKTVKGLQVDGVSATAATARSGKYPLSRYLYMFTNGWPKGEVLDFIMYMQSDAGQKIVNGTGFVSLRELKK
ncbi:PstS family phosphate ABC transporter substrate-binding protein [Cloacibacillus porcorum]|uniref:PstS family phosphate ABC transporter substrate-binding protein n=1 Tax=Cloacibacillus porcorum TaxID=1197717 RepID=UPI00145995F3|nr:PstS family phosphate ABC transporter substrate-binding protein [Cloacibacillus porcorum]MCC8183534.1 PstS family phosphate ABC transporter substrate-binding protein [Cloacibacillus porcorum]MCD8392054.1 PstS family phosphate ABC transporter substrate-binding protein [Cloacibacillus porcorum]MCI5866274.1 PstS family phosphate ABC transporter substrate-binding protein [Cloacibacillus porcorum]MDD7648304.1 PstS family phosphate ABC transporter substrate-binding protein [Cloacibacillus porcorum